MGRFILCFAASLVLGFATTVAVAWWLSRCPTHLSEAWRAQRSVHSDAIGRAYLIEQSSTGRSRTVLARFRVGRGQHYDIHVQRMKLVNELCASAAEYRANLSLDQFETGSGFPFRDELDAALTSRPTVLWGSVYQMFVEDRFGWPLPSLGVRTTTHSETGVSTTHVAVESAQQWRLVSPYDGIFAGESPKAALPDQMYLPTRAVMPAFLISGLFYAIGWLALFMGWRAHIRLVRRWQGYCPKCKYDLHGKIESGCPECGWNREANHSPATARDD